jgi:phage protein D
VTFHYTPSSRVLKPTYILEWGKSLISFQPSFATANQPDEVIVRHWNPKLKQKFEGKATRADLLREGVLDPTQDFNVRQGPLTKKTEIVTDLVVQSDDEAKEAAKKRFRVLAQGLIEGKGQTVGLPDLRAGGKIKIAGLGRYNGLYVITGTTHTIGDSGYTTSFSARKEKDPNA